MKSMNTTWKHIRRSPYQAFGAIFVMAQTFFVISVFTFIFFGSFVVIRYFESLPQLRAFFKDEAKKEEIQSLEAQLKGSGKVADLNYVDKDEAFKRYKVLFKDDPLMLELVTPEILPASFEITTVSLSDQAELAGALKKSPIVQEVDFPKDAVEGFARLTNALRRLGAAMSVILALDSVFLIMLIISMKISQKKEEIEILKLLSATNWYIRWPFVLEGITYGVTGAIIGWVLASSALLYLTPFLKSQLPAGIPLFPVSPLFLIGVLGVELIVAVLLGIFSSILAALRYLRS
jgi:cell division transport system permease protein